MGDGNGRQPDKATGTGRHSKILRGPELYPTPPALTLALLRALRSLPHDVRLPPNIWEPASGMGHMAWPLVANGYAVKCSDVQDYGQRIEGTPAPEIRDFLQVTPHWLGKDWAIVTNPPFSIAADFVRHGLKFCPTVMVLERLAFLESQARADILEHNLAWVLPFDKRPPMMHRYSHNPATGQWEEWSGPKSTSAMAFAWFIFKRWSDGVTRLKRITWDASDVTDAGANLISSGSSHKDHEPAQ